MKVWFNLLINWQLKVFKWSLKTRFYLLIFWIWLNVDHLKINISYNFFLLKLIVYVYCSVCLFYRHQGGGRCTLSPPGVAVACMPPLGWPLCRRCPLCLFGFSRGLVPIIWWGGGVVCWGCGDVMWWVLTWTAPIPPVFSLRSLHTDFVCRYLWSLDAPVGGPHQSYDDPILNVSTRLQLGLLPLWCEATGYPFQVSRRLHPKKSINRGDSSVKNWLLINRMGKQYTRHCRTATWANYTVIFPIQFFSVFRICNYKWGPNYELILKYHAQTFCHAGTNGMCYNNKVLIIKVDTLPANSPPYIFFFKVLETTKLFNPKNWYLRKIVTLLFELYCPGFCITLLVIFNHNFAEELWKKQN